MQSRHWMTASLAISVLFHLVVMATSLVRSPTERQKPFPAIDILPAPWKALPLPAPPPAMPREMPRATPTASRPVPVPEQKRTQLAPDGQQRVTFPGAPQPAVTARPPSPQAQQGGGQHAATGPQQAQRVSSAPPSPLTSQGSGSSSFTVPAAPPTAEKKPKIDRLTPKASDIATRTSPASSDLLRKLRQPDALGIVSKMQKEVVVPGWNSRSGISLSGSTGLEYYSYYMRKVEEKINLMLATGKVPHLNRATELEGLVDFTINEHGKIERLAIVSPSGQEIIDDYVAKSINESAPFASLPSTWEARKLNVRGVFVYYSQYVDPARHP